ncbi:MAG: CPBP family intramembrane glutamic endopeptidase [Phocaeicola sp.]
MICFATVSYRGVLLGLLSSSLKQRISSWGNPSILITAILFGLMHALCIDKSNYISFDIIYFIQMGVAGYIWGWITIKSRSLLLGVLSHNLKLLRDTSNNGLNQQNSYPTIYGK